MAQLSFTQYDLDDVRRALDRIPIYSEEPAELDPSTLDLVELIETIGRIYERAKTVQKAMESAT